MAASMRLCTRLPKYITNVTVKRLPNRYLSTALAENESEIRVEYPPVEGRYPPGDWGDMPPKYAWSLHKRGADLAEIKDIKLRLEAYAGSKEHYFYLMRCHDRQPDTLRYKQSVTKTQILGDVPAKLEDLNVDSQTENIKSQIENVILQQNNQVFQNKISFSDWVKKDYMDCELLKRVMYTIMNSLSFNHPYLLSAQVDENARMESFWGRAGNEQTKNKKGTYYSMISLQYQDTAKLHLRTEKPSPLFVAEDDELCLKPSMDFPYSPASYGQALTWQRPITTCGHWIGDPCEFSHLSLYTTRGQFYKYVNTFGLEAAQNMLYTMALSSGFGACLAQAHNQGFFLFRDVTYPFTTQTVVYGGGYLYFGAYQLNTLRLWVDDQANPKGNVAWISGPRTLFSRVENGEVVDYNEDTLKRLVRCFCLEPEDRGVDMRPYAANSGPLDITTHINTKGEPLIERKKIGKHECPRNPVYF